MSTPSDSRIEQLGTAIGQPAGTAPGARAARTAKSSAPSSGAAVSGTSSGSAPGNPSPGRGGAASADDGLGDGAGHDGLGSDGSDGRPPEPERPMPPYLKRMPELIQDLWKRGVQFNLDSKVGDFLLDGFYTNGALRLTEQEDGMVAVDKRGRKEKVSSFDDIARINFRWWRLSTDKDRYIVPQRPWIDAFTQNKWVTRKVIYVPAEDTGDGTLPT